MFVDLHIHSTFSDGFFTPKEIIDTAIANKIGALSITDHDSVNGYLAALEYLKTLKNRPKMFSGIELSTQDENKNIHVLGYHFDTFGYIEIDHEEAKRKFFAKGKDLMLLKIGESIEL